MQIRVLIDGSPGTMARVLTGVRRLGMAINSQHLDKSSTAESNELTIDAEGQVGAADLARSLGEIKGVISVLNVGPDTTAGPGATAGSTRRPQGGVRGNIVDQIVTSYPKILRYLDAFEADIDDKATRSARLMTLGEQVGLRMMQGNTDLDGCNTIKEALAVAVPVLKPISDARAVGSQLHMNLSIFTRRQVNTMDLVFGAEATKCDFMSGLIQGIVNSAPLLPEVTVEETSCRTNGDEECVFQVT